MIFASTEPVNDDPWPYTSKVTGSRGNIATAERFSIPVDFDPRPEFNLPRAHEANPILVELRQNRGADWARPERYLEQMSRYLRWTNDLDASSEDKLPWTAEQRGHARRVLSKWLAVFK